MKKLKFLSVLLVVFMLATLMVGCTSEEQDELITYVEDTCDEFDDDHKEVIDLYNEAIKFDSTESVIEALEKDVLPKSNALIEKQKDIDFKNSKLEKVHGLLIESLELEHKAYETMLTLQKEDNSLLVDKIEEYFDDASEKFDEYLDKREKLATDLDVEFED